MAKIELYLPSPDISSLLLVITILISAYVTIRCMTQPNTPSTKTDAPPDRVKWVTSSIFLTLRRNATILLSIHHALLALYAGSPIPTAICPYQTHLSPTLFTWSTQTTILLLTILIFGSFRLLAFSTLGENFTFQLSRPKSLVTTGLYAWVQHPSYTCQILVVGANAWFLETWVGVIGCWVSPEMERWMGLLGILAWVAVGLAFMGLGVRVRDEERLLKKTFGREWEEWHGRTKRFVPGIL